VKIPAPAPNSGAFYHRFIPRNEMDIAVASAGVSITLDSDDNITAARVALGAVAATPLMVPAAVAALVGNPANADTFAAAGEAAAAAATPIDDMRGGVAQRKHLSKILTIRALDSALNRIRETR
jgi:carbon-monoxide dehydrogenase medium subunit